VERLIGVYTNPHLLVEYPDEDRYQLVALHFAARPLAGDLTASDETTDVGYFRRQKWRGWTLVASTVGGLGMGLPLRGRPLFEMISVLSNEGVSYEKHG
jgi:hypothetical protein